MSLCGILLEWRLAAHGETLAPAHSAASAARLAAFDEVFVVLAALCLLALTAAWQMRARPGA